MMRFLSATTMLLLALALTPTITQQAGGNSQGGNAITNSSFETQPSICDTGQTGCAWHVYRDAHSTPADATVTVDQSRSNDGNYSAKIDMTVSNPIGFIGLYQIPPFPQGTLTFNNLTSTSNSLDFWFYIQPKYTGTAGIVVRVLSMTAKELDYAIDTNPGLSYFNNTSGNPPAAAIKLNNYPADQWNHLTRNLKKDWQTFFGLNETINWIEFDSLYFLDYQSKQYSETTWVDLVQVLYGAGTMPQPPNPPNSPGPTPFTLPSYNWIIVGAGLAIVSLAVLAVLVTRRKRHATSVP